MNNKTNNFTLNNIFTSNNVFTAPEIKKQSQFFEYNSTAKNFFVKDCILSDYKKDFFEFKDTVKKFFKLEFLFLKDDEFSAILSLNDIFRKVMLEIDQEYDHSHEANTDIEYFIDEKFNLFFKITDMNRKWKVASSKDIIMFTIDVSNNFAITTNSITKLSNIPNLIDYKLYKSFMHICNNISIYNKELSEKIKSRIKAIAQIEFES